jgi:hypothetical protein
MNDAVGGGERRPSKKNTSPNERMRHQFSTVNINRGYLLSLESGFKHEGCVFVSFHHGVSGFMRD